MSAPLRLLVAADPVLPVPPPLYGGIERVIADLVAAWRGRGHAVALLAHRDSTAASDARLVWPAGADDGWRGHLANTRALSRAVREFRPHVIHSFSRLAYLGAQLLRGVPKLMSYQRLPTPRTVRWSSRLAARSLHFSGCSEFIAGLGRAAGGAWTAIPNCVDAGRYTMREHVADDAPLVFLSRLEAIKGAHEAIAIAKRAGRRLVIAGNRVEQGDGAGYFDRHIAPHLDGEQIRYVGPVDDAQKNVLLGEAAAMLLPISWDEPFGIVMIEALACGTPVIAYRRGAVPEVVRDGVDGFVVDDEAGAVAAVARLGGIARAECRAGVMRRFDVPVVAAAYERLFAQLVGRP